MFVGSHCLPIVLLPLLGGWTTSPTICGEKICVAQLFSEENQNKKQKPMQGIHMNPSQAEKGKIGE